MGQLDFSLCDGNGSAIAELNNRLPGAEVDVGVMRARTATVTLSLEDPAAGLIQPFATRLKAWLDGEIVLNGRVLLPRYAGGAGSAPSVTISAADPKADLDDLYALNLGDIEEDQGEIAALLVENADDHREVGTPSHGIIRGSLPATVDRRRFYADGKNIGEALDELAHVQGGQEWELEPLDEITGEVAALNTHSPRMGVDRLGTVVLEYNLGRHTAGAFVWEPGGGDIVNRFTVTTAPDDANEAQAVAAWSPSSQELYGMREAWEIRSDMLPQWAGGGYLTINALTDLATDLVEARAFPLDFFEITPVVEQGGSAFAWDRDPASGLLRPYSGEGYGAPPRFAPSGEYWIGDEITVIVRETDEAGGESVDLEVDARVMDARLTEVDAGVLVTELECTPSSIADDVDFDSFTAILDRPKPLRYRTTRQRRKGRH